METARRALGVLALCGSYGLFRLGQPAEGRALRVAVVQGNVPQDVKWDRRFREETFRTHEELTRSAAAGGADLVVWSESATAFVYQREPEYQQRLSALVRESGAPLLFGSPAYETKAGKNSLRNRAYLLGPGGQVAGWQDKQQLVPFGEFVPFKRLLFFARPLVQAVGSFEPGERPGGADGAGRPLRDVGLLRGDLSRSGPAFRGGGCGVSREHHERRLVRAQRGLAPAVREPGRSRAVENRRPIARSANTGISGFVDVHGRIISASELFVKGQYRATLALSHRTTLYTTWGDWLPRLCVLIAIALLFVARFRPRATCLNSVVSANSAKSMPDGTMMGTTM